MKKIFTKDYMILEIKRLREFTTEKPVHTTVILKEFRMLSNYGVIRELCDENFMKKKIASGLVFYSWNFDTKLTLNDFDYFFAKAIKQRASYYKSTNKVELKNNTKEQSEIDFLEQKKSEIISEKETFIPNVNIVSNEIKIKELEELCENKSKEIKNLQEQLYQKSETIKELICSLNEPQPTINNDKKRVVSKNTNDKNKPTKYLKIFGIKIYEKN